VSKFQVWAPAAKQMELELSGKRVPMIAGTRGWWSVNVPAAKAGDDYAYFVDGQGPLPDPRSPYQPHGVHGRSRLVDHRAFRWSDERWQPPPLSSAVIYELHVGTFTREGTFEAAISRLEYLTELGVTHVELMPVGEFPGQRGWGYDGVDLYAPHHAYGGPEGLKRLVDACHARGLAVLLDVVYNHLGPDGNYLGRFGPYFSPRYSIFWGEAVNFDGPGSEEVRRFFIDNALMWLRDYHVDGLRLDAVHAIFDTSATHFLEQLTLEVELLGAHLGRHLTLIAESDLNDPRIVRPREAGGYGINAQWSDDFHHALHAALTGERDGYYQDFGRLADIAKALRQAFVYDGCYSEHRARPHGRPLTDLAGYCFLGYFQNHDQIGNRAKGDRATALVTPGRLKVAAALVMTAPFVPMLFQGEEWGASSPFIFFTDHSNPTIAKGVREGRRREFEAFGWKAEEIPDPQAEDSFLRSKLDWNEARSGWHAELLNWWKSLIRLRRSTPALTDGRLDQVNVEFDEDAKWLRVKRGSITTAINLGTQRARIPLGHTDEAELLLASEPSITLNKGAIEMSPDSAAIVLRST
jgi:maltooligosyltrehalose trehalohydrolase